MNKNHIARSILFSIFLLLFMSFETSKCFAQVTVEVEDFNVYPDDLIDDVSGIQNAINYVNANGGGIIKFKAGVYELNSSNVESYIFNLLNLVDVSIEGAVDTNGEPTTTFLRKYAFKHNADARAILSFTNSQNITLKNIIFDNYPRYSTAGQIVNVGTNGVDVKIFNGNPLIDSTYVFCSNLWDMDTGKLKKVGSTTFGSDVESSPAEYRGKIIGNPLDSIIRIPSANLASKVQIGDGFSWHFGWKGSQLRFDRCSNIQIDNIKVYNAMGFAIFVTKTENINSKKVKIIADGNQLAVSPRDGFHITDSRGYANIDSMYVEGVRHDGQNIHGTFGKPSVINTTHSFTLKTTQAGGSSTIALLKSGSKIGLWKSSIEEVIITVDTSYNVLMPDNSTQLYVETVNAIPDFVNTQTLCSLYGLSTSIYRLTNSTFKNIAGVASLIRNDSTVIQNCVYENIMYPGILVGGTILEGEGPIPKNIIIENNTFRNSGWIQRQNIKAALGIRSVETNIQDTLPYMRNIKVEGNAFYDCDVAIAAERVIDLNINDNVFVNVGKCLNLIGCLNATGSNINCGGTAGSFGLGNLLVVRIGDGLSMLSSKSAPVFLDEITKDGTLLQSLKMPTEVSGLHKRVTLSGDKSDEGYLAMSSDGKKVSLIGYDTNEGFPNVSTSGSATIKRVIAIVDGNKNIDTRTNLGAHLNQAVPRSAVVSGNNTWATGGGSGVVHTVLGTDTNTVISSTTGRVLSIFDDQLYATTTASTFRLAKVGTGLPTASGQTFTNLQGLDIGLINNPLQYVFIDMKDEISGVDIVYVANANNLQKFSLVDSNWVSNGSIPWAFFGLTGEIENSKTELYGTVRNSSGAFDVVRFIDLNGYNSPISGNISVIYSAPYNTTLRGLNYVPVMPTD